MKRLRPFATEQTGGIIYRVAEFDCYHVPISWAPALDAANIPRRAPRDFKAGAYTPSGRTEIPSGVGEILEAWFHGRAGRRSPWRGVSFEIACEIARNSL